MSRGEKIATVVTALALLLPAVGGLSHVVHWAIFGPTHSQEYWDDTADGYADGSMP